MPAFDPTPVIEGRGVTLRPLVADDWDALFAVASDRALWAGHPAWDRYQEPVFRAFFDEGLADWGSLAVVERDQGRVIGSSRYRPTDDPDAVEIGWTFLARDRWGGGMNAEIKRLMIAHALDHFETVEFRVGRDNARSRRAMEKVGGVLTDRLDVTIRAGVPVEHVVYEVTRTGYALRI